MKVIIPVVLLLLLIGCTQREAQTNAVSVNSSRDGASVAAELTRRYHDTRADCGSQARPAFLCSGIILRGTDTAINWEAWDPSPNNIAVGGISFSFIRSDYKMTRIAMSYTKGFIFYPVLARPEGKFHEQILCFFPIDGDSDHRTDNGCGGLPGKYYSQYCSLLGITTGAQWADNYHSRWDGRHGASVCSFDVRSSQDGTAVRNFNAALDGGRAISPDTFNMPNDMKMKTWAAGIGGTLPIEAFFYYIYQGKSGLAEAQRDQRKYKERFNTVVPIIYMTMPATLNDTTTFSYRAGDQAVQ